MPIAPTYPGVYIKKSPAASDNHRRRDVVSAFADFFRRTTE